MSETFPLLIIYSSSKLKNAQCVQDPSGHTHVLACAHSGSNRGPSACKADVMTTTLWALVEVNGDWEGCE